MKVTAYDIDWKEEYEGAWIEEHLRQVGGGKLVYDADCVREDTDGKMLVFSSHPLTEQQLRALWEAGDFGLSEEVWEGETFDNVLEAVREGTKLEEGQ